MRHLTQLITFIAFAISVTTLSAQTSEVRSVEDFNGIKVSSSVNAELVKGNENKVEIKVKGVELDKVKTEVEDGVLKVGMRNNWNKGWKYKKTKVDVVITYTEDPSYISCSSSSDLIGRDVIRTKELEIITSSSADMKIQVDVDRLKSKTSSSSDLEISGRADWVHIKASSSSDVLGEDLMTKEAIIEASSSSDVEISVSESIEANASSSSDIIYYGSPTKRDINKSSSGSVHQKRGN